MTLVPNYKFNQAIHDLQAALGFTGKDLDGKRGNDTMSAIIRAADNGLLRVEQPLVIIKAPELESSISVKADPQLRGVHQDLVDIVIEASNRSPVPFDVIEGLRSAARQKELVAKGASKTTDSRHLTGHAVDLWPKDPATGNNLPSDAAFARGSAAAKAADQRLWKDLRIIAAIMKVVAKEQGVMLEWGGDWGWDAPHFQLNRVRYPK